jgi:hypothetical protein
MAKPAQRPTRSDVRKNAINRAQGGFYMLEKIKRITSSFLAKLEEANKKSLGTGKLDCCSMNKQESEKKAGLS